MVILFSPGEHRCDGLAAARLLSELSDGYGLDRALTILPVFAFLAGTLLFIGSFFYKKDLYDEHSAA